MLAATSEVMNVWSFVSTVTYVLMSWCLNADRFKLVLPLCVMGYIFLTDRRVRGCQTVVCVRNMSHSFVICSDYGMMQVTSTLQQTFHINTWKWFEQGWKIACRFRVPTNLNACLMMLDIVLIFMLICRVYSHRDNKQFRVCVVVNYSYVNFVEKCIIQKNQNTNLFLTCYNRCNYYFGRCAQPWDFYVYMFKNGVLVSVPVCIVRNTYWCCS